MAIFWIVTVIIVLLTILCAGLWNEIFVLRTRARKQKNRARGRIRDDLYTMLEAAREYVSPAEQREQFKRIAELYDRIPEYLGEEY